MSVPAHKREIAKREILKQAKSLEQYTIKKTCNYQNFQRKRYRSFLVDDLNKAAINCYNNLIKAFYSNNSQQQRELLHQAFVQLEILNQQLDAANTLYQSPIEGMEHWASLIIELQNQINIWTKKMIM